MFSRGFTKDRNGASIQLLPGKRPTAVQRLTTVNASAAVNSAALNAATKFVAIRPSSYDCYVFISETGFAGPASLSSFHRFCPAGEWSDIILPESTNTQTLSIIADGTVPTFIIEEY